MCELRSEGNEFSSQRRKMDHQEKVCLSPREDLLKDGLFLMALPQLHMMLPTFKTWKLSLVSVLKHSDSWCCFLLTKLMRDQGAKNNVNPLLSEKYDFQFYCLCFYPKPKPLLAHISYSFSLMLCTWLLRFSWFLLHQQVSSHYYCTIINKHTIISPILIETLYLIFPSRHHPISVFFSSKTP